MEKMYRVKVSLDEDCFFVLAENEQDAIENVGYLVKLTAEAFQITEENEGE